MLNGTRILITGGTGSFGQKFIEMILKRYSDIREIIIFSRQEEKQQAMAKLFPDHRLRFITGDMGTTEDVVAACKGVDIVIHTAALRIVPEAEQHPFECVKTNILGAQNLIDCAVKSGVRQIIALSTDMASLANNAYGASKMLSDKLFIAAHHEHPQLKTAIIRYGNMFGSTGTVIPFFIRKAQEDGILPVTDPRMTRFMATLENCVEIALKTLEQSIGGEIIAPKLKSYNIMTVAKAIAPMAEIKIVGLRPGEKIHEEMITRYDSFHCIESKDCYIIIPSYADKEAYCQHYQATPVAIGFEFNSENNPDKFSEEEIRLLIQKTGLQK